jgi:hemerythrin
MRWSNKYATGVEGIDDQHRMLFKMTQDFREALNAGRGERVYDAMLIYLNRYAIGHFRFEEECMDRYQCPAAGRNREAHVKFVEVLSGFQQRYAVSGFHRADARSLIDTVDRWLADHVCRIDVRLKRYAEEP